MKSTSISAAVLSVAALTCMAASAEIYNSWLFDQMAAPVVKTRAEVKAQALQPQPGTVSGAALNSATAQRKVSEPAAEKTGMPVQTVSEPIKPRQ